MKRAGKSKQMAFRQPQHGSPPTALHSGGPADGRAVARRLRQRPPTPRHLPSHSSRISPNAAGCSCGLRRAPSILPPDPSRDFFYGTRYANNGRVKHPNWVCTQGLYGLGLKTPDTQSVYPYFYGVPGQNTIDSSSRPWFRPARFFQGLAHPFRPVGSYYAMGSYVPIYDLDPIAPGPGPYPYPFYFNWLHGG